MSARDEWRCGACGALVDATHFYSDGLGVMHRPTGRPALAGNGGRVLADVQHLSSPHAA